MVKQLNIGTLSQFDKIMKNLLIILSLVLINNIGVCQDLKKFEIGLFYSNDYTYINIDTSNISEIQKIVLKNPSFVPEKGIYGFAIGLNLSYNIYKRVILNLGLNISSRGHQNGTVTDFMSPPDDPVLENLGGISRREKFQFIEFPIKLGYRLIEKEKLNISCMVGYSINSIIRRQIIGYLYYKNDQPKETNKQNYYDNIFEITTVSWILNLKNDYFISERINFSCGLEIRYYSKSITDKDPFLGNLYAIGINTGINYKF